MYTPKDKAVFEFMSYWYGGVTASELAATLNKARVYVQTSIISAFSKEYPDTIIYNEQTRRQEFVADEYALRYSPSESFDAISVIYVANVLANSAGDEAAFDIKIFDTSSILEQSKAPIPKFRELTGAIVRKEAIAMSYLSRQGITEFQFSPHTIIRTSSRIFVRGAASFDDRRNARFIDLVPSRVAESRNIGQRHYIDNSYDHDWSKTVVIKASINSDLPSWAQSAAQLETPGDSGFLIMNSNLAIARHLVEELEAYRFKGCDLPVWLVEIAPD